MRCITHLNGAKTIVHPIQQELDGMLCKRMPIEGDCRQSDAVYRDLYVVPESHKLDVMWN
jgi:hypothetical protein